MPVSFLIKPPVLLTPPRSPRQPDLKFALLHEEEDVGDRVSDSASKYDHDSKNPNPLLIAATTNVSVRYIDSVIDNAVVVVVGVVSSAAPCR